MTQNELFREEYSVKKTITSKKTFPIEVKEKETSKDKDKEKKYGINKPKRIILRGRISHD